MATHATVNRLYAEIQTLLRKNLGAEGKGFFAMLKNIERTRPSTKGTTSAELQAQEVQATGTETAAREPKSTKATSSETATLV